MNEYEKAYKEGYKKGFINVARQSIVSIATGLFIGLVLISILEIFLF